MNNRLLRNFLSVLVTATTVCFFGRIIFGLDLPLNPGDYKPKIIIGFVDMEKVCNSLEETKVEEEKVQHMINKQRGEVEKRKAELDTLKTEIDSIEIELASTPKTILMASLQKNSTQQQQVQETDVVVTSTITAVAQDPTQLPGMVTTAPTTADRQKDSADIADITAQDVAENEQKQVQEVTPVETKPTAEQQVESLQQTVIKSNEETVNQLREKIKAKRSEYLQKEKEVAEYVQSSSQELKNLKRSCSQVVYGKIYDALIEVAEEEGVDLILDKTHILFGGKGVDLTDNIIKYVKQQGMQ
ncbi:MAG: OmpH family outer membrane protein [Elusimicrobiota bacterium]